MGRGRTDVRNRLSSTLFFAVILHGVVILGITFGDLDLRGGEESTTIRVTVLAPGEETERADADILAQVSARGSGTGATTGEPAAPRPAAAQWSHSPPDQGANAQTTVPGQPQQAPDVLVSRDTAARSVMSAPDPSDRVSAIPQLARPTTDETRPLTRLLTDDQRLEVAAAERELMISADTRSDEAARYLQAWVSRIERIGTQNFPSQARTTGIAGNPVLEVAIRADGTLADIVVKRSSGHSFLDQAALNILRLAAPFQPFDAEMRQRYDRVRVTYEWQFTQTAEAQPQAGDRF
jgi:protein TonB